MMAGPGYGEAGGQEPAENQTPTSTTSENTINGVESILNRKNLNEDNREVLSRILKKQKNNLKEIDK
jgi:hypothetical protein